MNPTMKKLQDKILQSPDIKYPKNSVKGYVAAVYYDERRCDVTYWAPDGNQSTKKRIEFPKDGDGVFHESLKVGDVVELSFKGKTHEGIYISGVRKKSKSKKDLETSKGQTLPLSTNLF